MRECILSLANDFMRTWFILHLHNFTARRREGQGVGGGGVRYPVTSCIRVLSRVNVALQQLSGAGLIYIWDL